MSVHSRTESKTVLYVTLYEGKNRQIRRMCDSLGLNILLLKRISVGEVSIGRMKPGEYRPLSRSELEKLFKSAGLPLPSFKSKDMKEKNENRSKVRKKSESRGTRNERRFNKQMIKYSRDIKKQGKR